MTRDVKMDAQMGVSKEGYAGRIEVLAGPTGRRRRSCPKWARERRSAPARERHRVQRVNLRPHVPHQVSIAGMPSIVATIVG